MVIERERERAQLSNESSAVFIVRKCVIVVRSVPGLNCLTWINANIKVKNINCRINDQNPVFGLVYKIYSFHSNQNANVTALHSHQGLKHGTTPMYYSLIHLQ